MFADKTVHLQSGLEDLTVFGFTKPHGRIGRWPVPHRVVVYGKTVDVPAPRVLLIGLHDDFGPIGPSRAVAARPHGDLQHLLLVLLRGIKVPYEAAVDLHLANVVVGRHVAATVPAFVTDAEQGDFVWSWMPVGGTFFYQRRRCCGRH